MSIQLDKPLAIIDLETTGTDIVQDRIVQIGVVIVNPPWDVQAPRVRLVNPGMAIHAEATKVHGVRDEDVREAPTFRQVVRGLIQAIEGCDIGGYNVRRFDIPMLMEECDRAGIAFDLTGRRILDALEIWHAYEPRTLGGAARRFADIEPGELAAHNAAEDARVTGDVLKGMADAFLILSPDEAVEAVEKGRDTIDLTGKFVWDENGEARFAFGKNLGQRLRDHVQYLEWMSRQPFPLDVRQICADAQRGVYPRRDRKVAR